MGFVLHCTVNTSKSIVLSCWYCIILFHIALYCVTLVDQDTPHHTVITSLLVNYMFWFPLSIFVLHCTVNISESIVLFCWYCIIFVHIALYCVTLVHQDTPRHTVITSPLVNYMLWFPLSNACINLSHIPSHIKHYSVKSTNT